MRSRQSQPTDHLFEITTAAAFAFSRREADALVLEVGLGGRFDATNVIANPAAVCITPVALDHQEFLGDTIAAIATEKAGIIKAGKPCIVGPQPDEAKNVITRRADQLGASLYVYGEDFGAHSERGRLVYQDTEGLLDLPLPKLVGRHQIANAAVAIAALRRGLGLGMQHIDTAEMYGGAEDIVGAAIAGRRDEVFLVSKVLPRNASRQGTLQACERSLARLRTDRLDCYLLHWRGDHPLEDTIAAFEQLRHEGKILSWGVSNFDVDDLDEARAIAGAGAIACNQVLYHLRERGIEHAVLPWCELHRVAVVGYTPFGQGTFPGPRTEAGRVLERIAAAHGATIRQVALRFLVRRPSLFTIPKAGNAEHTAENAGAGDLQLTAADLAQLDEAFPLGRRPRRLLLRARRGRRCHQGKPSR